MSLALDVARTRAPAGEDSLKSEYLRALRLVERLHRLAPHLVVLHRPAFAESGNLIRRPNPQVSSLWDFYRDKVCR